eukprot:TRINITY_DN259_c0_g1_i1.p1 TRINITY_DN259_c0_g1~~TRINITY_DN259_c0_g1_i1.p1  ORF type:complete len:289 (+),score=102.38 TRINITY_DN259_c0_g1_i1:291-1157(+)
MPTQEELQALVAELQAENADLKSQLGQTTAKLRQVEAELEPLKHKLQVTEQALLFNSNLVLQYMESNPLVAEFQEKLKRAEEKARASVEAEILPLKQKLRVAEQALLFNSLKQMETTLSTSPAAVIQRKEEEIEELRKKLNTAEQKANAIVDTEIRPLQHKLQVAEQALLFNADMYHNLMETSTAGREREVEELKEKLRYAEEQVKQLLTDEVEPLRKAMQNVEATIQPLRNKLAVAEQALLLNANLYFRHMEDQIKSENSPKRSDSSEDHGKHSDGENGTLTSQQTI